MARARLLRELQNIQDNMPVGLISIEPDEENVLHWVAQISGPETSPYAGGTFVVDLKMTPSYPNAPPDAVFSTRVFHPGIGEDGSVCLPLLREGWTLQCNISQVLIALLSLLAHPDQEHSRNEQAATLFRTNPEKFIAEAKRGTMQHAKPKKT